MKNSINLALFALLLISSGQAYASVGTHNGTINVGGAFNFATTSSNAPTGQEKKDSTETFLGGGFNVELGYLYLSSGTLIQGFDTRLSFGMNYDGVYQKGGNPVNFPKSMSQSLDTMYFQVGTTYQLGTVLGKGRILVDVLGLNLGIISLKDVLNQKVAETESTIIQKGGNAFLIGINLPLGTQYIFDNGFTLGFRHRLDFALGGERSGLGGESNGTTTTIFYDKGSQFGTHNNQKSYLAYNLTFSLGYVFGK